MMADKDLHLTLRDQLLTVGELPARRAWENRDFTPNGGEAYIEESFIPATAALSGTVIGGLIERTGLYVVKLYGVAGTGISAIRAIADAILAVFPLGWAHRYSASDVLRVRNELGPWAGQIIPLDNGFAACTVTIPWRFWTVNA